MTRAVDGGTEGRALRTTQVYGARMAYGGSSSATQTESQLRTRVRSRSFLTDVGEGRTILVPQG
jgi:hypothetical protein